MATVQQPPPSIVQQLPVTVVDSVANLAAKLGVPAVAMLLLIYIMHTDLTAIQITLAANTVQLDRCVSIAAPSVR